VTWRPEAWTYAAKATFAQTASNDSPQARSIAALLRGSRGVGGRLSVYGQYAVLRDRFAGVQQRHVLESGLSYAAIARPRQALRLDAGLGYLDEQRPTDRLQGATLTLGAPYRLGVTGTTQLTFEPRYLLPLTATDEWKYGQDVALTVAVNTILALKVAHTLRYAATPPPPSARRTRS
jgi:putative salt-induced outer membrane protein YdiY